VVNSKYESFGEGVVLMSLLRRMGVGVMEEY
jgi:hypothetical protein